MNDKKDFFLNMEIDFNFKRSIKEKGVEGLKTP